VSVNSLVLGLALSVKAANLGMSNEAIWTPFVTLRQGFLSGGLATCRRSCEPREDHALALKLLASEDAKKARAIAVWSRSTVSHTNAD
jgi:hypothetical protein